MVRCKFACTGKVKVAEDNTSITLSPVYSGSDENKEFWKWTPGGSIQFYTINEKAAEQFELGKEYYVDFSKAE
jgi:hypothetical protein